MVSDTPRRRVPLMTFCAAAARCMSVRICSMRSAMRQQFVALGGERDAARVAFEQPHAQAGFQRGDALRRDRRAGWR